MPRGPNINRQSLKDDIIKSSREIVVENGFSALNIRLLAQKIGCSIGTIYNVFHNLDDIILHVNATTLNEIYNLISKSAINNKLHSDVIKQISYCYINYSKENYNLWSMLFEYSLPNGTELPNWYQTEIKKLFNIVEQQFETIVPNKKEAEIAAKTIWAGIHGICQLSLTGKLDTVGVKSMKELTDSLIDNYLQGLKA